MSYDSYQLLGLNFKLVLKSVEGRNRMSKVVNGLDSHGNNGV